jgi:hypothetical protein
MRPANRLSALATSTTSMRPEEASARATIRRALASPSALAISLAALAATGAGAGAPREVMRRCRPAASSASGSSTTSAHRFASTARAASFTGR